MATTPPVCDFNAPAGEFLLKSTRGDEHDLASIAGPERSGSRLYLQPLPLCSSCLGPDHSRCTGFGNRWGSDFAAICSNDATAYPADSFANMVVMGGKARLSVPLSA